MDERLLEIYRTNPMRDGDVALVLGEQRVVTEIEDLANHPSPGVRRNLAAVLRELPIEEVQVAIARPSAELRPSDHAFVASLREELTGSGIVIHAPVGLPAAA